mgnify:CR=1 FL=1
MTALATPYAQTLYEGGVQVKHPGALLANANIPGGTLACNDSGVIKPYTGALVAAGALFLGFPVQTIKETTGSNYTPPASVPFLFRRGCPFICAGKAGDLPVAANIGGPVYMQDNFTCQATLTTGYTAATLLEVRTDGAFVVQLP